MNPGTLVASRFEIERVAGSGGMGTVYRAIDRRSNRVVALKVLLGQSQENTSRFLREAALLAELRHPGIVGFVASATTPEGEPCLVMDWLEGESLSQRVASGPLGVTETVAFGRRVAEALGHAHAHGVIHRDLKPGNIFLPDRDLARPLLLDFGIARVSQPGQTLTRTGVALGSPGYMAPEQARGEHVDGRADLFSLGCVLFRCLAGEPPFTGDALAAMLKAVTDPAPLLSSYRPDVPPALEDLIQAMLAKSPDARPRDTVAVEAALAAIANGAPPPAPPGTMVLPVTGAPGVRSTPQPAPVETPLPASARAEAITAPEASALTAATARPGLRLRWILAALAAIALIVAGVALFLRTGSASTTRAPAAGATKQGSIACLSTRCEDITYPDPAHVDPLELWDRVMPLVKDIDATATFTQLMISSTVDGTVALTGDMRQKTGGRGLVYSFVTKSGRALDVAAIPGRLVVQESHRAGKPVPWPVCKPRDVIRAAVGSGAPRGAPASLIYSAAGGDSEWTFFLNDRPDNYFRRIEGVGCGIKFKGAK
jgi:hypothetical protein